MRHLIFGLCALGFVACGTNAGTFNGSVAGISMDVEDAIFWNDSSSLVVLLAGRADVCDVFKRNAEPKNTAYLMLSLYNLDGGGAGQYVGPDNYTVEPTMLGSGQFALAQFEKTNANCDSSLEPGEGVASSGTVKLTSLTIADNGTAHGSFNLDFGDDEPSGSFNATHCDIPSGNDPADNTCE